MNLYVILDFALIIGCVSFAFFLFDQKRTRASWAKFILATVSLLGVGKGIISLMLDMGWLVFSSHLRYRVDTILNHVGGLLLGFILCLVFSGQLLGIRRNAV